MGDIYTFGPFHLDRDGMRLLESGQDLMLRPQTVRLLRTLIERAGMVVPYDDLGRLAWDQEHIERRTVIVTVHEAKKALGDYAHCIVNRPKIGYSFEHPDRAFGTVALHRRRAHPICIVLMPFEDVTRERDKAYLAVGITSELKTTLSKVPDLRVIPANPHTIQFLSPPASPNQYRIEGTIAGEGERTKIHVQLLSAADQSIVWSDTFKASQKQIIDIQPKIAVQIAEAVRVNINIEEVNKMSSESAVDGETYKLYLRGLYHWSRPTEVDLFRAIEYFREATSREQRYAQAFAGMAHAYGLLGLGGFLRPESAMSQAKLAALRCLEIRPNSAEGLSALAAVEAYHHWNWSKAEELLKRAIAVNGQYETAHHVYAMGCLMPQKRLDEALQEIRAAEEINPLSPFIVTCVGIVLYYIREYARAIEQFDRALVLQPHFHLAHWHRGWAFSALGRFDEAKSSLSTAVHTSQSAPQVLAALGQVYAAAGHAGEGKRILNQLKSIAADRYVSPYDLALIHVSLGDTERSLSLLQQAVHQKVPALARLSVHPVLDPLRSDPRFTQLLGTLNLPVKRIKPRHQK